MSTAATEQLPSVLFKYVKPSRVDILTGGSILVPTAHQLNDPFEMCPRVEAPCQQELEEEWTKRIERDYAFVPPQYRISFEQFKQQAEAKNGDWNERMKQAEQRYRRLAENYKDATTDKLGILCFTESKENLLMWAHYAEAHSGFVIQFAAAHDFFSGRSVKRVQYATERPVNHRGDRDLDDTFRTKSKDWAYEVEWRIFRRLADLEKRKLDDGTDGFFADLPLTSMSAIFLGCQMSQMNEQQVVEALKLKGREHIELFKTKVDMQTYSLVFSPHSERSTSRQCPPSL